MMGEPYSFVSIAMLLFAVCAGTAASLLVIARREDIASATGLYDDARQKAHARHIGKVPLIGGLAWFGSIIVFIGALVPFAYLFDYFEITVPPVGELVIYLVFVGSFFVLGAIDDVFGLSPRRRLVLSIAFVSMLIFASGGSFILSEVSDPFLRIIAQFGYISSGVTVLAVIALVNSLNMSDGRDGIVAGTCLLWSIALLSRSGHPLVTSILMLSTINCLILGWFNLKGRLFFGDAGTYAIAAAFACLTIFWHTRGGLGGILTSLEVCSLFLVLVLDMTRLIFLRVRAGKSPMAADHNHLHHRLDDRFGWPTGLSIYLGLVALPIVIAFQEFPSAGAVGNFIGAIGYVAVIYFTRCPHGPRSGATASART